MTWIEPKGWFKGAAEGAGRTGRMPEQLYTVETVGRLCMVSKKTVYKWIREGLIEEHMIRRLPNGQIRIRESAVLKIQGG